MTGMDWQPILSEELLPLAWGAIKAAAGEVRSCISSTHSPAQLCEFALLFGYLSRTDTEEWGDLAIQCLDAAAEQASAQSSWRGLYGTLWRIGWTFHHLGGVLSEDEMPTQTEASAKQDSIASIDEALVAGLQSGEWHGECGLIHGLVGIGVYFLERLPRPLAVRGIQLVVDHLEEQSEDSWGGITWCTPPARLCDEHPESQGPGCYDLGVAYGVPGIIQFLGEVVAARVEAWKAHRLFEGAIQWMLAQEHSSHAPAHFGSSFVPGERVIDSPLGWHHGDLGIGAVLLHIADRFDRQDWRQVARTLLDDCITRPQGREKMHSDASLYSGALGVAHIYNRVYHASQVVAYKEAANTWYAGALPLKDPAEHVTNPAGNSDAGFHLHSSMFSGSVGIALALLAAVTRFEPRWDRLLLLS